MIRKLPIGIQGFEKLRTDNFLYVDKTEYIYRLAQNNVPYFLSRPRRFGKSLLLSAMKYYFEGRADFFKGLAIEKLEAEGPIAKNILRAKEHLFDRHNYDIMESVEERRWLIL